MGLTQQVPPKAVWEALLEWDPSLKDAIRNPVYMLPVFRAGLTSFARGIGIQDAAFVGWQVLMSASSGQAFCASILTSGSGSAAQVTGMSSGVALTAVVEAALRLKTTLAIPGDYEWLILSAPGLLTQAWWFKSQHTDKSDLVQPVLTALAELDSNRIYPATEFLSIGRSLATARLTFGEFRSDSA